MNKQWTDDIRKRMERRQTAAPEGLLDDVKREMALRGLAPKPAASRRRAATARLWLYRTAAAAAVVLAVFLLWPGSDEERAVKPLAFMPTKEVAQAATRLQATRLHQPATADRAELAAAAAPADRPDQADQTDARRPFLTRRITLLPPLPVFLHRQQAQRCHQLRRRDGLHKRRDGHDTGHRRPHRQL